MFSIKCLGSFSAELRSIDRGMCFGFSDQPIVFEISSSFVSTPLKIRFFLKEDSRYDPVSMVVGEMVNDTIDLTFYNVKNGSSGGLRTPVDLVKMKGSQLSMFFRVDRAFDIPSFNLTYEFYESAIPEVAK
ncbi:MULTISPECIES: DUF6864 domain-containing function [Pseudomonas]|uniref:DUF6864 domain-containing function n=1 Tax=Pseudomonas TaxID=286 RepID=UPI001C65675C|nr:MULTISPECIES: hypothetical protein [unclassified Pseudomonas]MBW8126569.1 hypothetical protein [Pseudomonas sp. LAP_36]MBW8135410.1 hypothetical protein [Pseudomonas sp. PAMC 26818]